MPERPVTQMFTKEGPSSSTKRDHDGRLRLNAQTPAPNNVSESLPPRKAARHAILPINTSGATPIVTKRRLEQRSSFPSKKPKRIIPGMPWEHYEAVYTVNDFFSELTYAIGKRPNITIVHVRQFDKSDEQAIHNYLQFQHDNIVNVVDIYSGYDHCFVVLEEMKTCLLHVCRCPGFLTSDQMKSIFIQVFEALLYLRKENYAHGNLRSTNIFINSLGQVKLGNQECFQKYSDSLSKKDMTALTQIMTFLMEKDHDSKIKDRIQWADFLGLQAELEYAQSITDVKVGWNPCEENIAAKMALAAILAGRLRFTLCTCR